MQNERSNSQEHEGFRGIRNKSSHIVKTRKEVRNMLYDHRDRVFNEGDVVKHALLACFVKTIIDNGKPDPFVYAESHTGRAVYPNLPEDGRWLHGILPFSEKVSASRNLENLEAYKNACIDGIVRPGSTLYGSSGIVFSMLRTAGVQFRFFLWDSSAAVCHSLLGFYEDWWPQVTICRGDGYRGVEKLDDASLVLVDPVSVQKERGQILSVLRSLNNKRIPFICWTALWGQEDDLFKHFRDETAACCHAEWVTWTPKEGETWGCQIAVPNGSWADLAQETLDEIRLLMDWGYDKPALRTD